MSLLGLIVWPHQLMLICVSFIMSSQWFYCFMYVNTVNMYVTEDIPDAVLKAVVGCSRKNIVGPTELLEVSKSLELRRVDDFDKKGV